jgi:hypothetical protein
LVAGLNQVVYGWLAMTRESCQSLCCVFGSRFMIVSCFRALQFGVGTLKLNPDVNKVPV